MCLPPRRRLIGRQLTLRCTISAASGRFNNVQPVTGPDGTAIEGMLLFCRWNAEDSPGARAYLVHENHS